MQVAQRTFTAADQQEFARLSGDGNPMHMDALAARRTQAGAPVVHGMHLLLWSLDALLRQHPELGRVQRIRAQFQKFVLVGEPVTLETVAMKPDSARWTVCVDGGVRCKVTASFTAAASDSEMVGEGVDADAALPLAPIVLEFADLAERAGVVGVPRAAVDGFARMYTAAAENMGAVRLATLAATSTLVGMVCPGLHSIYSELNVEAASVTRNALHYTVAETDERFRALSMEIDGGGWTGAVGAFLRTPPVPQPTMTALRGRFDADRFQGVRALIVGGSRGLGELTAKLLASGGAQTWITYRNGREDALAVAAEITADGGSCRVAQWDATEPAERLMEQLDEAPTHVYYFATPLIYRPQVSIYQPARLREFSAVYVDGFWGLMQLARSRNPSVCFFYPSTVFVEERPAGMTEYSMAKAAGEVLCADINASLAPTRVVVTRLPRLATDQTASVTAVETESAADVMTEVIRAMHP